MWWIVVKDVQRFLADRTGAVMTIVIPAVLAALLGTLFAPRDDSGAIELLLVDLDHAEPTRKLIEALDRDATLQIREVTEQEALRQLERGKASAAVVLPPGTSEALQPWALFQDTKLEARLLYDPSQEMTTNLVTGLFTKTLMEQVASGFGDPAQQKKMFEKLRDELGGAWKPFFELGLTLLPQTSATPAPGGAQQSAFQLEPPLKLVGRAILAGGPSAGYNTYAHNFAGMICMFLLFFAQDVARNLLQEKESGILGRLRLSSVPKTSLLIGSGLSAALLSLACALVVYSLGFAAFGIEVRGSILGFAAVLLALATFMGGFALFLAGVGGTEARLSSLGLFSILIMSFLGGAWMPSFVLPAWAQTVGALLPTHWATEGLAAMTWRGLDLAQGLVPAGILCLYGIVLGAVGVWRFRWN